MAVRISIWQRFISKKENTLSLLRMPTGPKDWE
jgi:hypothetical protein